MTAHEGSERGTDQGTGVVISAPTPSVYRARRGRTAWRAPLWQRLAVTSRPAAPTPSSS